VLDDRTRAGKDGSRGRQYVIGLLFTFGKFRMVDLAHLESA